MGVSVDNNGKVYKDGIEWDMSDPLNKLKFDSMAERALRASGYTQEEINENSYIQGIDPYKELGNGAKYKPYKSSGTDYSSNGPVFKDETTKDLLAQLKDAKTAFYLVVGMFIFSFMLNIAFAWSIWNSSSDTVYPLSPKEIQKRMKAHSSSFGAQDSVFTNNKKQ